MPAPATIEDFLDVVRKSNQVDPERLESYLERYRGEQSWPSDPKHLAALLVGEGICTSFQAEQFLLGKYRGFNIGGYRLLERLGQGGTGTVFLAEHEVMKRRVALKILSPSVADDPSALERFRREAQAAGALDHPNIVRAYDFRQEGQLHVLVMEYVSGPSLQQVIESNGPMSVPVACEYVRQAAIGLQHAHDAGMVHRDIKPANLLVDSTGVVKILDMGLARFSTEGQESVTQKFDDGMVMGTADYLAPEQAINLHDVDARADIYSLGATLYALLAGGPPFPTGTVTQKLLWHQLKDPVRLDQRAPTVPTAVADIVARMMAKAPEARYASCAEVAEILTPYCSTTPTPQGPVKGSRGGGSLTPPSGHGGKVSSYVKAGTSTPGNNRRAERKGDTQPHRNLDARPNFEAERAGPPSPTPRRQPAREAIAPRPVLPREEPDEKDTPRRRKRNLDIRKDPRESSTNVAGILMLIGLISFVLLMVGGVIAFLIWGPSPSGQSVKSSDPAEIEKPVVRPPTIVPPPPPPPPPTPPSRLPDAPPGQLFRMTAPSPLEAVLFLPDGRRVISAGADGILRLWEPLAQRQVRDYRGHKGAVGWLMRNRAGSRLLSASADGTARLWSIADGKVPRQFTEHKGRVWAVIYGKDENEILTAGEDGIVRVWDVRAKNPPRLLQGHQGAVTALAYRPVAKKSPKRRHVLSASADKTLRLWDLDKGEMVREFKGHSDRVTCVVATGVQAISGSVDKTLRAWQIDTGKPLGTFASGHQGAVLTVAISANGQRLLSGGADRRIILWDIKSRKPIGKPFTGHTGNVTGLAFTPDGRHFVSCSQDRSIRVWALP